MALVVFVLNVFVSIGLFALVIGLLIEIIEGRNGMALNMFLMSLCFFHQQVLIGVGALFVVQNRPPDDLLIWALIVVIHILLTCFYSIVEVARYAAKQAGN